MCISHTICTDIEHNFFFAYFFPYCYNHQCTHIVQRNLSSNGQNCLPSQVGMNGKEMLESAAVTDEMAWEDRLHRRSRVGWCSLEEGHGPYEKMLISCAWLVWCSIQTCSKEQIHLPIVLVGMKIVDWNWKVLLRNLSNSLEQFWCSLNPYHRVMWCPAPLSSGPSRIFLVSAADYKMNGSASVDLSACIKSSRFRSNRLAGHVWTGAIKQWKKCQAVSKDSDKQRIDGKELDWATMHIKCKQDWFALTKHGSILNMLCLELQTTEQSNCCVSCLGLVRCQTTWLMSLVKVKVTALPANTVSNRQCLVPKKYDNLAT